MGVPLLTVRNRGLPRGSRRARARAPRKDATSRIGSALRLAGEGTASRIASAFRRPQTSALRRTLLAVAATLLASAPAHASPQQDYILYCMGCHGAQAEGVPGKVPPLAHALGRFMRTPEGRNYILRVPGAANSVLSDAQLAAVLNWLAQTYDGDELRNKVPLFTTAEVTSQRHSPLTSVLATRRDVVRALAATGPAPPASY
jgi:mono/diheme cytochrome c family protein